MDIRDDAGFFAALDANEELPYGKARTARAEELVVVAERMGSDENLAWALLRLITAYNYGGESPRTPVPLSRLLKLWDEHPEGFDEQLTHHLFWDLKWITSSLLAVPEVPLPAIRGYLADMERRYRTAGHSLRPVQQSRFYLARHIGADAESGEAFEAWLAADRDRLADCDACERREQARWLIARGRDADALELLAPTLDGALTCAEEPQVSLAASMLPLVREGDPDRARAHHLRGYRSVRGKVSTYAAVAEHIEFCALTGNEGRGIEILAEHRAWLERPQSDPSDHADFLAGVAVLLRRLVAIGGPGLVVFEDTSAGALRDTVERELFEIAARFDARNGNDAVSSRVRRRLAAAPVAKSLPLGLRSARVAASAPAAPPAATVSATHDVSELLLRARESDTAGHPRSGAAWRDYAAAAGALGQDVDAFALAAITEDEGVDLVDEGEFAAGIAALTRAAAGYRAADAPGRAVGAEVRIAMARFRAEDADAIGLFDAARAEAEKFLPDDAAPLALVLHHRAIVALTTGSDDVQAVLTELHDLGRDHGLAHRRAAALHLRAEQALQEERTIDAEVDLSAAITLCREAERPWSACRPLFLRSQVRMQAGDPAAAEADMRAALETAAFYDEPQFPVGHALTMLANAVGAQERPEDALPFALEAAHVFDGEGDAEMAAACRRGAVGMLFGLGRDAEAAAILEELLPDIEAHHGPEHAMHERWALGMCLRRLGDARDAARHLSMAAEAATKVADRATQAEIAVAAAHALDDAGMAAQAQAAFGRAIELLRAEGDVRETVRALRAKAWSIAGSTDREDPSGVDRALALFGEALRELAGVEPGAGADVSADADDDAAAMVAIETAGTQHQLAHLLARADRLHPALTAADRAAAAYVPLLPQERDGYLDAVQLGARIEAFGLEQRPAAVARLEAALKVCAANEVADVGELTDLRYEVAKNRKD
ncbi:tetratricopeptide repeat protein [Embleya sp. NPDC005971]|uniref:tetratricopeptide repeat protein n=1 Tax=Embleya sp. NPDC005971 TaxID=3156724 RepID=UPI0033EC8273